MANVTKKTPTKKYANPRKSIRFEPDPGTLALIDTTAKASAAFNPRLTALVTEESYRGCGVAMLMTEKIKVGDRVRVKVGHGPVLEAEVRWRTDLDAQIIRLGLMYLA